jgi:protein STE50
LSRVSHRASHIPNRPLNLHSASASRENLALRQPGSAGLAPTSAGLTSHEQLPVLQKTSSRSSYPTSPASPTGADFGTTPIDASFGDRIEPPSDPPATARLQPHERTALPTQRSRSGTASHPEPSPRKGRKGGMDRYALMAGDDLYDTDGGDADDEFERNAVIATHYDDEDSDHPSESEEEHDSVDGEDTPTTQGWGGGEGRSPTGNILQWSEDQVADFVSALSPALKPYCQTFADEGVNGEALAALTHDELRELGVSSVGHRLTILKAVYEQKIRSGVKIEEGDYVPLSAEGEKGDLNATQDDITRVIESIRLRDQRIIAAEAELRALKQDLERISDEYKKFREETLPVMRMVKDQRTPLPDPSGGNLPSPRDLDVSKMNDNLAPGKENKGSSLSRKFSTKKLFLGGAPKQPSPTHPPQSHTPHPREVRDDPGGTHLEASAAAMAASSHLTASMTSQASPNSVHGQQLSPTSPAYAQAPSSGGSYHQPSSGAARSFPREGSSRHGYGHDDGYSGPTQWQQGTLVGDAPGSARQAPRRQAPTPSPREDEIPQTAPLPRERERDRDRYATTSNTIRSSNFTNRNPSGDRDNPQVEIFKSFRVSIEDPCRVVLPVALKRYNITDDWRQYALYIVHGDQERCLGLEEKPLLLFKQLDKEGRKPMFMLRRHASPQEGWSGTAHGAAAAGPEKVR